ncbi:MAG: ATP-dependent DNA helicase [Spirochaetes bacterium GWF1_31_7]|nr:MAG: ATP-dependent DNA helicase [Spirochaetes bacterium GWE1_32_154]OHD52238.1 MAG: ATP-dependent DNA helicase [Spirochaetes bacterium GWE2_31_10]OHD53038.1 MAG: ATP-dependent DNA helicase [Spirochaetes bacterium GWF1_31_7]OHD80383.1 MAG: ATP-dependent DNA helicase [Spirochaetes bacterium RIFOXYB1_FULL_32_8]HBD96174.1 ATP-dependent DNA helicase [Spirochaetia bacterium]
MKNLYEEILSGESKVLEFKRSLPEHDQLVKTVTAFSNSAGGRILIGVDNDRTITGIDDNDIFDLQDKIVSIIYDSIYPNVLPEIYSQNIIGKTVLVIEVFRGNFLPYYIKSSGKNEGTYIRIGASNRKSGYEQIIELERQKRNISFDEEINYTVPFSSLNLNVLTAKFHSTGKSFDAEKMKNLKLTVEEHGQLFPTNGLLILLGEYEHCTIKCGRFRGKTMEVFLDKKEYHSDIFSLIEYSVSFIKNHINIRGEIKGLQRTDTLEIPEEALRESVLNALIHRDYSNAGRDIKIGVYDDLVNIVSPGGFPNTLTESDIEEGRSEIRNKVIARVMKELNYIEQWGSGIKRIKSSCINHGLEVPAISEKGDFIDVELYRSVIDGKDDYIIKESSSYEAGLGDRLGDRLGDTRKYILEYISANPQVSIKSLSREIGVSTTAIENNLKYLKEKRYICRVGSAKSGYWEIKYM